MSISAIGAYSSAAYASCTNRTNAFDSSAGVLKQEVVSTSTVTISSKARQVAASDNEDAVKNNRLPNWMASLLPPCTDLSNLDEMMAETRATQKLVDKLTADGDYSDADRAKVKTFIDRSTPFTKMDQAKQMFRENHRGEIAEYAGYLDEAWFSSLKGQGVQSHGDYVNKVLRVPDDNSTLRNTVVGKLLANPRAVELMGILGIEHPAVA